ncbi:3220_t:CDS:2, partial [Acaulospora colombiana]
MYLGFKLGFSISKGQDGTDLLDRTSPSVLIADKIEVKFLWYDGNLMYKKGEDGQVIGVLADFDLSSLEGKASSNTKRTGSLPFMALDLLSKNAVSGKVAHDYCHDAEAFFWVGVYDTACYDNGHTVDNAVPAQWNLPGANTMREERGYYLWNLNKHDATSSQENVWNGLSLLRIPLTERKIFDRPEELPSWELAMRRSLGDPVPEPFDASLHEPSAVKAHFLKLKDGAEHVSHVPGRLGQ